MPSPGMSLRRAPKGHSGVLLDAAMAFPSVAITPTVIIGFMCGVCVMERSRNDADHSDTGQQ